MSDKARTRKHEPTVAIIAVPLGKAVMLQYRHPSGMLKTHLFTKGTPLYTTRDGKQLIIAPVRVRNKEIH